MRFAARHAFEAHFLTASVRKLSLSGAGFSIEVGEIGSHSARPRNQIPSKALK